MKWTSKEALAEAKQEDSRVDCVWKERVVLLLSLLSHMQDQTQQNRMQPIAASLILSNGYEKGVLPFYAAAHFCFGLVLDLCTISEGVGALGWVLFAWVQAYL